MNEENFAIRLKHFLESQGLTNSQFADTCSIPRPTLSQILTGRNKKISDILIGMIHKAYPQLSILWLLFGEGEMMVREPAEESETDEIRAEIEKIPGEWSDTADEHREIEVKGTPYRPNPAVNKGVTAVREGSVGWREIEIPPITERKISHITVYYDDSTFETFYPKK